jgi:hypothetical protein
MGGRATLCLIVGFTVVSGCSRQATTNCAPKERYSTARSAPPVQIPDDLSPPNESDALRLPPDPGAEVPATGGECLESPPPFSGDVRPGRRDAESRDEPQAPAESPAEAPAPDEASTTDAERVIAN